jgi:hypothetical protein
MKPLLDQLAGALKLGARIRFNHDPDHNAQRERPCWTLQAFWYWAEVWMADDPDPDPIRTECFSSIEECIQEAVDIAQGGDHE